MAVRHFPAIARQPRAPTHSTTSALRPVHFADSAFSRFPYLFLSLTKFPEHIRMFRPTSYCNFVAVGHLRNTKPGRYGPQLLKTDEQIAFLKTLQRGVKFRNIVGNIASLTKSQQLPESVSSHAPAVLKVFDLSCYQVGTSLPPELFPVPEFQFPMLGSMRRSRFVFSTMRIWYLPHQ